MPNRFLAAGALLALAATAAWAQLALRPGKYNVTMELTLPGAPISDTAGRYGLPEPRGRERSRQGDDARALVRTELLGKQREDRPATSSRSTPPAPSKATSCPRVTELTIKSDTSYAAVMQVNAAGVNTTLKITGEWAGATCTE